MTALQARPEFSRPFIVERLGASETVETIEANLDERGHLAQRFGLVALDHLAASLRVTREPAGLIRVSGRLEANVVQSCVISLDPFPSHLEDSFVADFSERADEASSREISLDAEYEPPEPIEAGAIDLGELVAQHLALALDPHPRAPGVALERVWPSDDGAPSSPFAVLERLKRHD